MISKAKLLLIVKATVCSYKVFAGGVWGKGHANTLTKIIKM